MDTYNRAEAAIMEFFGDTSRTAEETKEGLVGLRDHITTLIEALEADGA